MDPRKRNILHKNIHVQQADHKGSSQRYEHKDRQDNHRW